MPIYEYQCSACQQRFEVLQRIDDPGADCPVCGAAAQRMVSAPVFHDDMAKGRERAIHSLDTGQHGHCCDKHHRHHHEPH